MKNLVWHLGECPFVKIPCPLKCFSERGNVEETRKIERRLIGLHQERDCSMRLVTCEFCDERIRSCEVNMHLEKCIYFPVPCPNACTFGERKLKRKELPTHLETVCPLQHIPCLYSLYGCKITVLRKDLEQHEKDVCYLHNRMMSQHLENRLESVLRIQENTVKENVELKSTLSQMSKKQEENCFLIELLENSNIKLRQKLNSPTPSLSIPHKGVLDWTLTKVSQKLHNAGISHSEPFYAGFYRFMMDIDWNTEDDHVGIFTKLIRGEWDDQLLWPVRY